MKEKGKVIRIGEGVAVVETMPVEACTKCCSCGAGKPRKVTLSGEKAAGLRVGDAVEIEIADSSMMRVYLLMYALPLIIFVASVFLMYLFTASPLASFLMGLTATALTYFVIGRLINKGIPLLPDTCVRKDAQ